MKTSKQASCIQHCTKINSAKDKWFANTQEFRLPVDKTIDRFVNNELSTMRREKQRISTGGARLSSLKSFKDITPPNVDPISPSAKAATWKLDSENNDRFSSQYFSKSMVTLII